MYAFKGPNTKRLERQKAKVHRQAEASSRRVYLCEIRIGYLYRAYERIGGLSYFPLIAPAGISSSDRVSHPKFSHLCTLNL